MALLSAIHDAQELLAEAPGVEDWGDGGAPIACASGADGAAGSVARMIPAEESSAMEDMNAILGVDHLPL